MADNRLDNYNAATSEIGLTPQEQNLYLHHLNNLYNIGPVVHDDGSRSTAYVMGKEIGGKQYNIPKVWHGKIVSDDEALANAQTKGLEKFPSYATPDAALSRYMDMHKYMEADLPIFDRMQAAQQTGQ